MDVRSGSDKLNFDCHVCNHSLDLRFLDLSDSVMPDVLHYLSLHSEISEVDFGFNHFGSCAVKLFAQSNRSVSKVSFCLNPVGDEGLIEFARFNSVVVDADFGNTGITSNGVVKFLELNKVVSQIDFSWNLSLSSADAKVLLADKRFKKIDLQGVALDEKLCEQLHALNLQHERVREEKPEVSHVYHQDALIEKINLYLGMKRRELLSKGYCNGLSLLWLYKMHEKLETWLYNLVKKIVNWPTSKLVDIEMDIEKLLSNIDWAQNVKKYTKIGQLQIGTQFFLVKDSFIHQRDIHKIFEFKKIFSNENFSNGKEYSFDSLRRLFHRYVDDEAMVRLAGKVHAIAVFRRDLSYFCYDANYDSGEAKVFELGNFKELFFEIAHCLGFKNVNDNSKLTLEIDIAKAELRKSPRLHGADHHDETEVKKYRVD